MSYALAQFSLFKRTTKPIDEIISILSVSLSSDISTRLFGEDGRIEKLYELFTSKDHITLESEPTSRSFTSVIPLEELPVQSKISSLVPF